MTMREAHVTVERLLQEGNLQEAENLLLKLASVSEEVEVIQFYLSCAITLRNDSTPEIVTLMRKMLKDVREEMDATVGEMARN